MQVRGYSLADCTSTRHVGSKPTKFRIPVSQPLPTLLFFHPKLPGLPESVPPDHRRRRPRGLDGLPPTNPAWPCGPSGLSVSEPPEASGVTSPARPVSRQSSADMRPRQAARSPSAELPDPVSAQMSAVSPDHPPDRVLGLRCAIVARAEQVRSISLAGSLPKSVYLPAMCARAAGSPAAIVFFIAASPNKTRMGTSTRRHASRWLSHWVSEMPVASGCVRSVLPSRGPSRPQHAIRFRRLGLPSTTHAAVPKSTCGLSSAARRTDCTACHCCRADRESRSASNNRLSAARASAWALARKSIRSPSRCSAAACVRIWLTHGKPAGRQCNRLADGVFGKQQRMDRRSGPHNRGRPPLGDSLHQKGTRSRESWVFPELSQGLDSVLRRLWILNQHIPNGNRGSFRDDFAFSANASTGGLNLLRFALRRCFDGQKIPTRLD